jgi:hypothetical protein
VLLGVDCESFDLGIERDPSGDGPREEHTVVLEP